MSIEALAVGFVVLVIAGVLAMAWGRRTVHQATDRIERAFADVARTREPDPQPAMTVSAEHLEKIVERIVEQRMHDALCAARRVN